MTDRPPEFDDDSGAVYERESARRIPRWLKVVGIVVAVVILLVVIMMLISPGEGGHGPSRHGLAGGLVPPVVATVLMH